MNKFIHLMDHNNENIYVNINQISVIFPNFNQILVNGTHGEHTGLINLKIKSMEKLLRVINEGTIL